jgi:hypothetical protein
MNLGNFPKQPVEVKDYDITYAEWLTAGDNVQSVDVVVSPLGLTVESVFINDPVAKIWLSGGTDGTTYKLTVTMTSADGRVKQDEFKIRVKDV